MVTWSTDDIRWDRSQINVSWTISVGDASQIPTHPTSTVKYDCDCPFPTHESPFVLGYVDRQQLEFPSAVYPNSPRGMVKIKITVI